MWLCMSWGTKIKWIFNILEYLTNSEMLDKILVKFQVALCSDTIITVILLYCYTIKMYAQTVITTP